MNRNTRRVSRPQPQWPRRWIFSLCMVLLLGITGRQSFGAQTSGTHAMAIDFTRVDMPLALQSALRDSLSARPADVLSGSIITVVSFRPFEDWALATVAILDTAPEDVGMGDGGALALLSRIASNHWIATLEGTDDFEKLVVQAPNDIVGAELKAAVQAGEDPDSHPAYASMKFPWDQSQSWKLTTGWHQGNSVDFAPASSEPNKWVLAAHSGTVTRLCNGGVSANLQVVAADGTTTQYVHIDKSTIPADILGQSVPQGRVLGRAYNGAINNDGCGTSTGAHVHFTLPAQDITIDGWTADSANEWHSGTETKVVGSWFNSSNARTEQSFPPVPANQNLVQNGDFSAGTASWWKYGDASWAVYDGVLHFKREQGGDGGSVGQNLAYTAPANAVFEIHLDLGNDSDQIKQAGIFLRPETAWDDAIECHFTLAPHIPLQTYAVRGRTGGSAWQGLTFEVWPDPPDGIPDMRMDNVHIEYLPDYGLASTECLTPVAANTNLVQNGDFSAGTTGWWNYGDAAWAVYDGVLHFNRGTGGSGGSVGQNLPVVAPADAVFEVQMSLGNTSNVAKNAGVFLRSNQGWQNAIQCHFALAPHTPLRNYTVRGRNGATPWYGLTFEVWPDPPDGIPAMQMDTVSVQWVPGSTVQATECIGQSITHRVYIPLARR